MLLIGVAIGSANSGGTTTVTSSPAATDQAQPSATKTPTTPAPVTAFRRQRLLDTSGTGSYTTQKFTVGGSGDYDIYWRYSPAGEDTCDFSVEGDGGNDTNVNNPNLIGSGGNGVIHVYNDAGTHYLQVQADQWTLKVVTAK